MNIVQPVDKYDVIVFDEIAVEPSVYFDRNTDKKIRFQDNSQGNWQPVIPEKHLVFMKDTNTFKLF